jgi:hypothetical protein
MLFWSKELKSKGFNYPSFWDEELSLYRDILFTPTAVKIYDEIQERNPLDFTESFYREKMQKISKNQTHKLKAA